MKRRRGNKKGKQKKLHVMGDNDTAEDIAEANAEDNSGADEFDNDEVDSTAEAATPSTAAPDPKDKLAGHRSSGANSNPPLAVYGRVKVKIKTSKTLESQHTSSEAPTHSDTDKSSQQVGCQDKAGNQGEKNEDSANSVPAANATSSLNPSKSSGSIKVKSSKGFSSAIVPCSNPEIAMGEKTQAKETGRLDENPQYKKEELNAALDVIKKIMKMDAAEPFNAPVDPVALGIPDYFDVIDTPMDFGTICSNIEKGVKYLNSADVYRDVQYIWGNCYKYNNKGDYILELMKRVRKNFAKYWAAAGLYNDNAQVDMDSAGNNDEASQLEDKAPLWKYVTRLGKIGSGGGNCSFICKLCKKTFTGSYTRVKAHLLQEVGKGVAKCMEVTQVVLSEMQALEEEAKERAKAAQLRNVPIPPPLPIKSFHSLEMRRKRSESSSGSNGRIILRPLELQARDHLHAEIAKMFYSGGLPFSLARNPYYVSSYAYAASHNIAGYLPPGYNLLKTTLLQREKANIDRLLQPVKRTWSSEGVSIVSNGWSDSETGRLINIIAVNDAGPVFIKAVDCSGETKDKYSICDLLRQVINKVGASNVVQVITDDSPNCNAAGSLIEGYYPYIYWTPCVVHTLDLALRTICAAKNVEGDEITYDECSWICEVVGDAFVIKKFLVDHLMRLSIHNTFDPLKLIAIPDAKFASAIVMLKRFKLVKDDLRKMVSCAQWSCYSDDDVMKARFVKEKLLDDAWWDKIDYILFFTRPIYDMLRTFDTNKPCLHLIIDMWNSMIEKVRLAIFSHEGRALDDNSAFCDVIHKILSSRWKKNNIPLLCLAHSLNPMYYTAQWLLEDASRVSPHEDGEVACQRNKCFKRLFPDQMERNKVLIEYADFATNSGSFGGPACITSRSTMDAKSWWAVYGGRAPNLRSLALKLFSQPASSSSCERNWSIYSFVQSLKRDHLTPEQAEDLLYVHSNLRLLSRRNENYYEGERKMWDTAGDRFDPLDDIGMLGIAELSLEEPYLEAMSMTDEGEKD